MLTPGPETLKIRRLVAKLTDEDLRTKGPKDLMAAVEKAGLSYASVRERVNNEFARARRLRGIRKGRGRRVAAEYPTNKKDLALFKLFTRMDELRKQFNSWKEIHELVEGFLPFINGFGSTENFLEAIQIKQDNEESNPRH